jgi:hypothetical protein
MAVTLGNAGSGSTLVATPSSTTLATKSVTAGSGIAFTTSATDITIANTQTNICIVRNSADITYLNGSAANLTFNTDEYDPAGMHSTSVNTDRINILENGMYNIISCIALTGNAAATDVVYNTVYASISGVSTAITQSSTIPRAASGGNLGSSRLLFLSAGDYVTSQVSNSSGQTVVIKAYGAPFYQSPILSVMKVSN